MTECCSWTLKCLDALELRCNGKLQFIIYLSEISWVSKPVINQHNQRSTHLHSCTCAGEGGATGSSVPALTLPCSLSRSLRRVTSCRRLPSSCCRAWQTPPAPPSAPISALPWAPPLWSYASGHGWSSSACSTVAGAGRNAICAPLNLHIWWTLWAPDV